MNSNRNRQDQLRKSDNPHNPSFDRPPDGHHPSVTFVIALAGLSLPVKYEKLGSRMDPTGPHPEPLTPAAERRWERLVVVIPVNVTAFINGQRLSLRGQASDISRGGMRLFVTRELDSGTSLMLEFLIPYNTMEFVLRGIIRNRDGFTHGVEFLNPTVYQQQMIERTCKVFKLLG